MQRLPLDPFPLLPFYLLPFVLHLVLHLVLQIYHFAVAEHTLVVVAAVDIVVDTAVDIPSIAEDTVVAVAGRIEHGYQREGDH